LSQAKVSGKTGGGNCSVPLAPAAVVREHRPKEAKIDVPFGDFFECAVARVLTGGESKTDAAKIAIALEKNALLASKTWVEKNVREWADVKREAASRKEVIHVGRIFPIVTEKFSELPPISERLKPESCFKVRGFATGRDSKPFST
jgi:hypothetical protein